MVTWIIVIAVLVILLLVVVGIYNRLVQAKNRYENAFAQIDVQLKRRYDLIPNLVETAKGYAKHEKETLDAVISARNTAYPDLKANTSMEQLMEELTSTENKIAFSRQAFNDAIMTYNIARERFPAIVFSGMLGFGSKEQLEIQFPDGGREAPKVEF